MKKLLLMSLVVIMLIAGCSANKTPEPTDEPETGESTVIDDDGKEYASDRIVVKFASEPTEEQINEIAKICEGKVRSKIGGNVVVYQLEKTNIKRLHSLITKISELDYVDTCSLDAVNELQ